VTTADPVQWRRSRAEWRLVDDLRTATGDVLVAASPEAARIAYDVGKNPVVLFQNDWSANYFSETNKGVELSALPVQTARE